MQRLMAAGSQKPTFKDYNVKPFCAGCGRKLIASKEPSMWFAGLPARKVFGYCCWGKGAT